MSSAIRAVIFDFGGVLGLPQDPARVATMASLCALTLEEFQTAYGRNRRELDRGTMSEEEYWGRILEIGGIAADPDLVARIEREDSLGWTRTNKIVVDWGAELRAAGYRTAILSNMPATKLSFMRASGSFGWINDFQPAIFSCEYRLVKPEPEIYQLCLDKLAIDPDKCIFLDDVPRNVEAARALGIHALHFYSAAGGCSALHERWGLPVETLNGGRWMSDNANRNGKPRLSFGLRVKITLTFLIVGAVVSGVLAWSMYRILNQGLLSQVQTTGSGPRSTGQPAGGCGCPCPAGR